jgi:glycerol-3-phosphate O-acyltransferase
VLSFLLMQNQLSELPPSSEAGPAAESSSRRSSITAPPPERTPYPGTMLERWGLLGRMLARLFFAAVFFPVEAVQLIRQAASQGTVVYVLRMRNTIEFLYFNYAFIAHALPLARFANGVRLLLIQPLGAIVRRLLGRAVHHDGVEMLRRLTRARRSSALFLRTSPFLIPPADFEGPYLSTLVQLQTELDRPILLVPLTVIWGRRPVRPAKGPLTPLFDPLFGDQDEPRLFRRVWQTLRHARKSLAVVCDPLNLREFLASRQVAAHDSVLKDLDAELLRRIDAERRVKLGPPRAHPLEIRHRVLSTPAVRQALARRAAAGLSPGRVRRQAVRILRRMQAGMTPWGLRRLSWMVRQIWKRLFAGFEVDEAGITRVQKLGKEGPMLFLPTHRSHLDYLIMSDLCIARDMVPPHIAAGINLSFWPMGWIFRTCGAFFLRRSYRGDELYATLLSEYLSAILREGHNVEIFIEGGRTRTGQVLPPKLGLLSMVADLAVRPEVPPVHIVPMSIGYDRVLEVPSMTRELAGGTKQPESLTGILRGARALRDRYGFVNVQFGEAFEVQSFLRARGYDRPDAAPEVRRRAIRSLGFHTNSRSARCVAITGTCLCAAGLLIPATRGVRRDKLLATAEMLGRVAKLAGARFLGTLWRQGLPLDERALAEAIELLGRDGGLSTTGKGDSTVFVVKNDARLRLEYYKNQMLQHLLDASLLAMVIRAVEAEQGELVSRTALQKGHEFLVGLLRPHFVHRAGERPERLLERGEAQLLEAGLVSREGEGLRLLAGSRTALSELAALLESTVEGCGATARALAVRRGENALLRKPLELEVLEQLQRWNLTGELRRTEACNTALVHTCIDWLCSEGILVQRGEGAGLQVSLAREHSDGRALEVLVEHTDRLLRRRTA